jgi:hypothetical protein
MAAGPWKASEEERASGDTAFVKMDWGARAIHLHLLQNEWER